MIWVNDYIGKTYVDGGRGPDYFDCWGLVREIRNRLGLGELPSYGDIRNTMPVAFTKACNEVATTLQEGKAQHGSIAAVYRGKICAHVAIVLDIDGGLRVLEINPETNCRILPLSQFERRYSLIRYYT